MVLTELLLGIHQLTEEMDWLLHRIQMLWNDPDMVANSLLGTCISGSSGLGEAPMSAPHPAACKAVIALGISGGGGADWHGRDEIRPDNPLSGPSPYQEIAPT